MTSRISYDLLLVDDDEALGELLEQYFHRFGHRLHCAGDAATGMRSLRREPPDLLILDVMLPDADGIDLCRQLRAESDLPILMLTARGDLPDRVLGLESGADDYLPKPFEPRELVARVETLLRRARCDTPRHLQADGLVLDPGSRRVELHGQRMDLTTGEFDLLHHLMASRGRVLSRQTLLDRLNVDAEVLDRAVDMAVSRLRAKLDDDARSPRFIRTIRGIGYQFVAGI